MTSAVVSRRHNRLKTAFVWRTKAPSALLTLLTLFTLCSAFACNATSQHDGDTNAEPEPTTLDGFDAGKFSDAGLGSRWLQVGSADEENTALFVPVEQDGDVPIQDGGQGGTHALIGLRFAGLGNWIKYQVSIEELDGDTSITTPELVRARPVPCEEGTDICKVSPIFVQLGGLAERSRWDGLRVKITGLVSNEDGQHASSSLRATLTR